MYSQLVGLPVSLAIGGEPPASTLIDSAIDRNAGISSFTEVTFVMANALTKTLLNISPQVFRQYPLYGGMILLPMRAAYGVAGFHLTHSVHNNYVLNSNERVLPSHIVKYNPDLAKKK